MIILLPPSQGKATGGTGKPLARLSAVTKQLVKELLASNPRDVYKSRIQEAAKLNKKLQSAATMPAIQRYTGVLYKALDYESIKNKEYIHKHVRIMSPLFGVLKANDNIPNYKFDITSLKAHNKWLEENTQRIKGEFVIDLLSDAYRKSVEYEKGIIVDFHVYKDGKKKRAGHAGKHIKGRFVRWLAENNVTDTKDFKRFTEDGYRWNGEVFVKESND